MGNTDDNMQMYNFSVIRDLHKRAELTIADLSERTGISPASARPAHPPDKNKANSPIL
jgi:hypothetical protein